MTSCSSASYANAPRKIDTDAHLDQQENAKIPPKAVVIIGATFPRRTYMTKLVTCPFGKEIRGENDDELVKLVTKHGKKVHSRENLTRDDILAMAQPV